MWTWLKSQIIQISFIMNAILLALLVLGAYYFIVLGKNIIIDRHSESTSTSTSASSSGSIAIGYIGDSSKGDVVEHCKSFTSAEDLKIFRQSLSVSQKLLSNSIFNIEDKQWYIFYSSFENSAHEISKVVKTADGVEKDKKTYVNGIEVK